MKGTCDMSDKCRSDRCFMGAHVCPAVWTLRRFRDIVEKTADRGERSCWLITPSAPGSYRNMGTGNASPVSAAGGWTSRLHICRKGTSKIHLMWMVGK